MLFSAFSLLAAMLAGDSLPLPAIAGGRRVQDAPAVVVHRQPAIPLVALRLSVLADDPPGLAGAGHLIQHLALPRLREQVAQVGGQVQVERTSDALVYTLLGPAVELEHLARALRSVLVPPRPSGGELLRASRELEEERLAEWETAGRHVRAALRARLFPADLPAAGTAGAALRLSEPGALGRAWSLLYRPERVAVVAVGDVRLEDVRAAVGELPPAPTPPSAHALRDTVPLEPLAPAEATRAWLGAGYPADGLDPAAVSLATRLLRDRLQARLPTGSVEAEHWWTHHGQAVAVVVAVPDSSFATARRALGNAVSDTRAQLSPARVREAARALRREMLFYSRTPERMAEVIGRFVDRGGEPGAAQDFYAGLDAASPEQVEFALEALLARTPVRVEVPPQVLQRRR